MNSPTRLRQIFRCMLWQTWLARRLNGSTMLSMELLLSLIALWMLRIQLAESKPRQTADFANRIHSVDSRAGIA